jgi:hypothetical protein
MEQFRLPFLTSNLSLPAVGKLTMRSRIVRNAQLLHDCYLNLTLPPIYSPVVPIVGNPPSSVNPNSTGIGYEFQWIRNIGYNIIDYVSITINGQEIVRHTGEWMKLFAALKFDGTRKQKLDEMTGNTPELYDPGNVYGRLNQYPHSIANTGVTSIVAGTGVSRDSATGAVTISIGQAVATTSNVTFANIYATADIIAYYTSDKRHKNNIKIIPNALEKISKLNGVTWEWNDDVAEFTKLTPTTGLIAQEVQEVLPEVVKEKEDGFLGLDYSRMMGLMVEAIKEQQTQIHSLTLELEKLKKNNSL